MEMKIFTGFRAEKAENGGWIIFDLPEHPQMPRHFLASFSNGADMLVWLSDKVGNAGTSKALRDALRADLRDALRADTTIKPERGNA